jgi:hypothetical protein
VWGVCFYFFDLLLYCFGLGVAVLPLLAVSVLVPGQAVLPCFLACCKLYPRILALVLLVLL